MNKKERYTSGFTILGHVMTLISVIAWLILFATKAIPPAIIIPTLLSDILVICTFYGIGSVQSKVKRLETLLLDKKIINKKDLDIIDKINNESSNINCITHCKNCGYQIFPEEKICSYCGAPKQPTKPNIKQDKN